MTLESNLFGGPEPTRLPARPEAQAALDSGTDPTQVAATYPDFSAAWAALAERALDANEPVAAYAYARTGYHRGLDQLRRAGWKGYGPVPFSHAPNQGFLRALAALTRAAGAIGDAEEFERCGQFLADSDPEAPAKLGLG
jgi:Protein of unknown function (DUF3151)